MSEVELTIGRRGTGSRLQAIANLRRPNLPNPSLATRHAAQIREEAPEYPTWERAMQKTVYRREKVTARQRASSHQVVTPLSPSMEVLKLKRSSSYECAPVFEEKMLQQTAPTVTTKRKSKNEQMRNKSSPLEQKLILRRRVRVLTKTESIIDVFSTIEKDGLSQPGKEPLSDSSESDDSLGEDDFLETELEQVDWTHPIYYSAAELKKNKPKGQHIDLFFEKRQLVQALSTNRREHNKHNTDKHDVSGSTTNDTDNNNTENIKDNCDKNSDSHKNNNTDEEKNDTTSSKENNNNGNSNENDTVNLTSTNLQNVQSSTVESTVNFSHDTDSTLYSTEDNRDNQHNSNSSNHNSHSDQPDDGNTDGGSKLESDNGELIQSKQHKVSVKLFNTTDDCDTHNEEKQRSVSNSRSKRKTDASLWPTHQANFIATCVVSLFDGELLGETNFTRCISLFEQKWGRRCFSRILNQQRVRERQGLLSECYVELCDLFECALIEAERHADYRCAKHLMLMSITFYRHGEDGLQEFIQNALVNSEKITIWKEIIFWEEIYYDTLLQETNNIMEEHKRWKQLPKEQQEEVILREKNFVFGQLGSYSVSMIGFGISVHQAEDFIKKHCKINMLPEEQKKMLLDNLKAFDEKQNKKEESKRKKSQPTEKVIGKLFPLRPGTSGEAEKNVTTTKLIKAFQGLTKDKKRWRHGKSNTHENQSMAALRKSRVKEEKKNKKEKENKKEQNEKKLVRSQSLKSLRMGGENTVNILRKVPSFSDVSVLYQSFSTLPTCTKPTQKNSVAQIKEENEQIISLIKIYQDRFTDESLALLIYPNVNNPLQPNGLPHPSKTGFILQLVEKRKKKTWKRRLIALKDDFLFFYDLEKSQQPISVVRMRSHHLLKPVTLTITSTHFKSVSRRMNRFEHCIEISQDGKNKNLVICLDGIGDQGNWITALQGACSSQWYKRARVSTWNRSGGFENDRKDPVEERRNTELNLPISTHKPARKSMLWTN